MSVHTRTVLTRMLLGWHADLCLQAAENVASNGIAADGMRLLHTREVIQDLDGIVLRDDPGIGSLTFDLVTIYLPRSRTRRAQGCCHCEMKH